MVKRFSSRSKRTVNESEGASQKRGSVRRLLCLQLKIDHHLIRDTEPCGLRLASIPTL